MRGTQQLAAAAVTRSPQHYQQRKSSQHRHDTDANDGTPPRRLPTDRLPILHQFLLFSLPFPARSHPIPATNLLRPPLVSISSRFPISIPVHRPLRHPLQAPRPIPVSRRREAGQGRCHSYLIHCAPGNRLDSCALLLASLFLSLDIRPLCLLSVLPLRYPSRSSDCDLCDQLSN
ncbi:hypothetical protein CCHR01_00695 [Colletotrichum chrysophilum]|uniref:Uncharacterized protein n=1 Tax=Colletotrichum chrysophilum TaxID=1836956 RepID=A0AAD9EPX0_9PEZI|nr:hypothetical protein CCHR01_00695 [Colletotrichum chrysophilum]